MGLKVQTLIIIFFWVPLFIFYIWFKTKFLIDKEKIKSQNTFPILFVVYSMLFLYHTVQSNLNAKRVQFPELFFEVTGLLPNNTINY